MKKLSFSAVMLLCLIMLLGCGSKQKAAEERQEPESIVINSGFISPVVEELQGPGNYSLEKLFQNQPCTVSILVDSSTIGDKTKIIDKNTVYGRIIKPYDDAMLGKSEFEYDLLNGITIPVALALDNEAVNTLEIPVNKNDIITAKGDLIKIKKPGALSLEANSFNLVAEVGKCEITEHIQATEVAAAQQKYKDMQAAAEKKQEEEKAQAEAALESLLSKENAKRAAVVALTNVCATDVYAPDGDTLDPSKFHKYADVSGEYLDVRDEGEWSVKDKSTWHIDNLKLFSGTYKNIIIASLDVSYDGQNYIISNVTGSVGSEGMKDTDRGDLKSFLVDKASCLTVSPEYIKDDRVTPAAEQNKSAGISLVQAEKAFEDYGKNEYPYGFKCHWITQNIAVGQEADGSWSIKVGVTIKNQFGTEMDTIAEGVVKGDPSAPKIESFFVYK